MDPNTHITFCCERWPSHEASGVYLPRAITHPTRVWILHQPCDLYTGGVITHRAHRELKRIMRFVNKRQPFWQQPAHLPSESSPLTGVYVSGCLLASICMCVLCVCVSWVPLKATIEGDKEQVSNRELPLILSCSFSLPPSFFLSLTRLTLTEGVSIIIWQIGVVDWGQRHRWDFMCVSVSVLPFYMLNLCPIITPYDCVSAAWVFIGYLTPFFPAKCWTFPPHGLDLFVFFFSALHVFIPTLLSLSTLLSSSSLPI